MSAVIEEQPFDDRVEGLFAIGGNIVRFSVELSVEENLLLLALFTAAIHLSNQ